MIRSSAALYRGTTVSDSYVLCEYLIVVSQENFFVLKVEMCFCTGGDYRLRIFHRTCIFHDQIAVSHARMLLAEALCGIARTREVRAHLPHGAIDRHRPEVVGEIPVLQHVDGVVWKDGVN